MSPAEPRLPTLEEIVPRVVKYYRDEREVYRRHSEPLDRALRETIARYFKSALLDKIKAVTLHGARIPPPPFYLEAKELSGGQFPDFVHLASVTYIDVIVFHDQIEPRTLFHAAVHAAQMEELGFERYIELYAKGFLKYLSWTMIPLERQAFQLEARFAASPADTFSVEAEIYAELEKGKL